MIDRGFDETKRIEILDFDLRAEIGGASRPYRDVRVAPEAALLHVAVIDTKCHQQLAHVADLDQESAAMAKRLDTDRSALLKNAVRERPGGAEVDMDQIWAEW